MESEMNLQSWLRPKGKCLFYIDIGKVVKLDIINI